MGISPTLNIPQARFLSMPHKFKAYVAGFGSGKTWIGCGGICKGFWEFPKVNQGYFAPTYPQIRDIFYPTVEEVAHDWGLNVKINESNKEVHFYEGRIYRGTTICRSMEKPETIVGFKIGNALVDELDVMKAIKAQQAWRKIIARMRYKRDGLRNGIDVTTTPEGFKFVYQQFVKAVREKPELVSLYGLVQASTFDNEKNLPPDYISSLLGSYPQELIKAYLRGQFVNLNSGTVYHEFDRTLNNCIHEEQPGEPIFIGMDFNVGKMAGIVHVKRDGLPCAVAEITNGYDTPDMIKRIKRQFWKETSQDVFEKTREIYIYPDASGDSRKSVNASQTDLSQLRDAGFTVRADAANPPVKDRVNTMNAMFCNALGERRYKVNVQRCPTYTENLEQQIWADNGEPDKSAGNDHTNDAAGYFIIKDFPIIRKMVHAPVKYRR
ncbi:terminase large subunit domain-containing protein [Mixta calida]|uniref:Terminase n=1 Tax=Mixta calida TaxID=665913 RepID=A0ABN5HBB8_9GAMM|nr:terminase family protein [Mixta calida]AUY25498.1 terminase [Mixta calida]MDU3815788.1 terminase family protein [Pantoea sp.]ORM62022.1 terminase [Mixta calida]DAV47338.1 MAG TPA: large terminase [Caudoviricetes sp.]